MVIMINDGGEPVEEIMSSYEDPRVLLFNLSQNRGRYYADALTLLSTSTEFWTPHDSDDESVPHRFEKLMGAIGSRPAVVSHTLWMRPDGSHFEQTTHPERVLRKNGKIRLGTASKYPAGIYRSSVARAIGGPHPELRGSYDTTFTSLLWSVYRPVVVPEPLYVIHRREGSLTTHPDTHLKSEWRREQRRRRRDLFNEAVREPVDRWPSILRPSKHVETTLHRDAVNLRLQLSGAAV